ncbi:PAS domain-containing protein [Leptolyngbya sp. KIOST-1]|uniref:PAS domain-containing protein n=1 Tax=Leptolyngbya sp. KIOST-1 TaxID=1229172 RepID=UPI000B2F1C49
MRKIFEYSNDAIFGIDPLGDRILEANPKANQLPSFTTTATRAGQAGAAFLHH